MAADKSDKRSNGLQIFLVVLVLVSMGLNVYLFRHYAEQDDGVEVMTSWADANSQIHEELTSITATLADLETRQSTQEASTQSVLETLTLIEIRQAAKDAEPAIEPNWLDKESWVDANAQTKEALATIATTLADVETRQSTQEVSTTSVLETLALIETRQVEEAAAPVTEPNWLDKESWADANTQVQESLASITTALADLEARQSAQEASTTSVLETLTLIETRQAADEAAQAAASEAVPVEAPVLEPTWVDKESWSTANQQIGEELSAIKAMLGEIMAEVEELKEVVVTNEGEHGQEVASNLEPETESDRTIQVMALAAEATYQQEAYQEPWQDEEEYTCPIVEVRLLPGDSVWGIVERFKPSPSPALVHAVVKYNEITDPRRLPVGFPVRVPMDLVNGG